MLRAMFLGLLSCLISFGVAAREFIDTQACPDRRLDKIYFVVCYNADWRIAYWVGYELRPEYFQVSVDRRGSFRLDRDLPPGKRSKNTDYTRSGYVRGHMAPAEAFSRSRDAMRATFVYSNAAPQTTQLNSGRWRVLEEEVIELVLSAKDGQVWVFTGNIFLDEKGFSVAPSDWLGRDGEGEKVDRVAIPTHSFKAILHWTGEEYRAYAFLMPNQKKRLAPNTVTYQLTVDELEALTGIDFFADPNAPIDATAEAQRSVWPPSIP